MKVKEVIPSRRWKNVRTGQTASIYGAVPWGSSLESNDWLLEDCGFTWRLENGTVGLGRKPAATYAEALEVMRQVNGFYDDEPMTDADIERRNELRMDIARENLAFDKD